MAQPPPPPEKLARTPVRMDCAVLTH